MGLKDFFLGQAVWLRSPMPARTVTERVNKAAGSMLLPVDNGVVGGVWSRHIRLKYRSSILEFNAKPVLSGRIEDTASGSSMKLRYRAPFWAQGFYALPYLFLTLSIVGISAGGWASNDTYGIVALLLVGPRALHALGTRRSQDELAALIDFLEQEVGATR